MKKVLLVTWINGENYGTLLQIYCLQEILKNINNFINVNLEGMDVKVLNYVKKEKYNLKEKIERAKKRNVKDNIYNVINKLEERKLLNKLSSRKKVFNEFRDKNLNLYPNEIISNKNDLYDLNDFDLYIIGSDQIWNPKFLDDVYLLDWVSNKKNKVSYAPSICVDSLTEDELKKYENLKNFKNISVREYTNSTAQIEKFLNKDIREVVDPVVLYGRDELLKYCFAKKYDNYCLSYLLGKNVSTRKYSVNFAKNNNLELKSIIAVNRFHILSDSCLYKYSTWDIGPLELINLIYNSSIVITDSFHILVISVLLHKNFIVLERENDNNQQNNRIIKFLEKVGLEYKINQKYKNIENAFIDKKTWAKVDKKIAKLRKDSFKFLIDSLSKDA